MANKAGNSGIKNNPSPPQKSPQSFQIGNTPNSYSNESSSNKQKLSFAGDRRYEEIYYIESNYYLICKTFMEQ